MLHLQAHTRPRSLVGINKLNTSGFEGVAKGGQICWGRNARTTLEIGDRRAADAGGPSKACLRQVQDSAGSTALFWGDCRFADRFWRCSQPGTGPLLGYQLDASLFQNETDCLKVVECRKPYALFEICERGDGDMG